MSQIFEWIGKVLTSWKFWIVVAPWNVGIRVRLGKNAAQLGPGVHLRIPMVDVIYLVNTRVRFTSSPTVTITGKTEGTARVICATIGYQVSDPLRAALRFEKPSAAVQGYTLVEMSSGRPEDECRDAVRSQMAEHGVDVLFLTYTSDVDTPSLRLLQNEWGIHDTPGEGEY